MMVPRGLAGGGSIPSHQTKKAHKCRCHSTIGGIRFYAHLESRKPTSAASSEGLVGEHTC